MKLLFNYCLLKSLRKLEKNCQSWKKLKRLEAIPNPVSITSIVGFISSFLTKIINHRNNYRTCIKSFREHFDTISVDVDFSESLSIPVKYGPLSLHWSQISRNSALWHSQEQWRKGYDPYLSNDHKHDQVFVHLAIE